MNYNPRIIPMAMLLLCVSVWLKAAPKPKKELYVPMDYSTCGYHASELPLPDVRIAVYVAWHEGDCSDIIQQAIDKVSSMKPDANGQRGAVLLGEGRFRLDRPLRIAASGVVLRGKGRQETTLVKHGVERGAMIYVEGHDPKRPNDQSPKRLNDTIFMAADKTPAGSMAIVTSPQAAKSLKAGQRIDIVRPCTWQWIDHLGMRDLGGGLDYTGWKPTDIDITWDRTISRVAGDTVFIDSPITTTLSREFGGAYILPSNHKGEITECGIENMTLESDFDRTNAKDEDHCWDAIYIDNVRDAWVRRIVFRHFAGSAVNIQKPCSRITVEDCIATEPVSEVGGWRRQVFLTRGQQTLFQRCLSRQGIHDFAAGFCAAGPNAFVQCDSEESLGFSGSIGSWAAGLLFDIVNIDGHDLHLGNMEQFQFGTGWNSANTMLWQCTASTIWCYSPDDDNRSSGHGCWGTLTGNAEWTSSNDHVMPRSLFYHQLEQRLNNVALGSAASLTKELLTLHSSLLTLNAYLLPRNTNATSSPSPDEAMKMAQLSLTEPRLTMEMWIDSVPFTPAVTTTLTPFIPASKTTAKEPQPKSYGLSAVNGQLVCDGRLITGNQYAGPWWSGRVKDNYVQREGRPSITRFVPGREGAGWTDRMDSVISYMAMRGYSSLYHHYGLWYDLRRTDHERVRRADGDVWAPLYEQPFARSGQGTAWDGLSRYDLTKPNRWYWSRLQQFADKTAPQGMLLFNNHYFQHNILEAGAHWVDCPWRPVNNIQMTDVRLKMKDGATTGASEASPTSGNPFPEPVPFAGDKRIFIAEQFYNEEHPMLRTLHRQYIRMCLDELKDQPNAVHLISGEYTGPLHFTRFWLQTIAEWERETGRHPLVALSCTRDAQDSILADPELSRVVDIIDIRYWHYNTQGLWAPTAGANMAPRQWMRKMKVGKTGFDEAYKAVREMRDKYPDKAVTFYSQQYPAYGWAILMAGGSLPSVKIGSEKLLMALARMKPVDGEGCVALGDSSAGYLVYARSGAVSLPVAAGRYRVNTVDTRSGEVRVKQKMVTLQGTYTASDTKDGEVVWLEVLDHSR